jgi:3-dehydroquinate dehydratase II
LRCAGGGFQQLFIWRLNLNTILVLNGPNLNLLGTREPEIYGYDTLEDINDRLQEQAKALGLDLHFFQSNAEHELVEAIHRARAQAQFIIINPGAFTHTSVSLRDAFSAVQIPFIEIHLSNVFGREEFRKHSFLSGIAVGVISGLGSLGYELALQSAFQQISKSGGA